MSRDVSLGLLDRVKIASPCSARREDMVGDDKVRHCEQCNLKVHNFSAMSRDEAEALLAGHFAADGTAILADCPAGVAAIRSRARRATARIAALLGVTTLVGLVAARASSAENPSRVRAMALAPFATVHRWLVPSSMVSTQVQVMEAGYMWVPPISPVPAPQAPSVR